MKISIVNYINDVRNGKNTNDCDGVTLNQLVPSMTQDMTHYIALFGSQHTSKQTVFTRWFSNIANKER